MFFIPPEINALSVRVHTIGCVGDQLLMDQLKSVLPSDLEHVLFEYAQDAQCNLSQSGFETSDLSVISVCADIALHEPELISRCKEAAANSSFTVLFVPICAQADDDAQIDPAGQNANRLKTTLEQLQHLARYVDTLVLVPTQQFTVPIEIVCAIPMLLTRTGYIGIDFADIKTVLSDAASTAKNPETGFYVAQHAAYSGADELQAAATTLTAQVQALAQQPLQNCVASIVLSSDNLFTLDAIINAADKIYDGICIADAIRVFSAPRYSITPGTASLLCLAGKIDLRAETLLRLK